MPLHRKRMDELGVKPADIKSIDDISNFHSPKKRPSRHLPVRPIRGRYEGDCTPARFERNYRQADSSRLYEGRYGRMGDFGSAVPCDVWRKARDFCKTASGTDFYGRNGFALRSRAHGLHCNPCFRRQHRTPAYDYARLRHDRGKLHTQLLYPPRGGGRK